jgi:predicted CXXCH cytochrome family protein
MKFSEKKYRFITLLLAGMMGSLVIAASSYPEVDFKLKMGAKGVLCLKCHETFQETISRPFIHPLLKTGDCSGCHDPHTSSHADLLIAETRDLCFGCHKEILPEKAASAHSVVAEADCEKCHNSHGSNYRFILQKSENNLCADCHKEMMDNLNRATFKHEPVQKGKGCINCHDPHASAKWPSLLRNDTSSLCATCHKSTDPSFARSHMNYPVVGTNCDSCHNTHGSNRKGILFDVAHAPLAEKKCTECHESTSAPDPLKTKKQGAALCRECHKEMVDNIFQKKRVHWAVFDKSGCLNCHNPHATAQKKLLKGSIVKVCGQCHSDTIEQQKLINNTQEKEELCEPIKKGNCISCHSPHASDNVLLIDKPSLSFDLCGECHEWLTHSTHPIGDKVVDQRNKNVTLSCLSCHKMHGTNPKMLHFGTTYEVCIQCHIEIKR